MARAAADRQYEALHADRPYHDGTFTVWTKEPTAGTPFHFRDGVSVVVTAVDVNPDDDFLTAPHLGDDSRTESGDGRP